MTSLVKLNVRLVEVITLVTLWLKRGEVLPDGRSVAQERALIHGKSEG